MKTDSGRRSATLTGRRHSWLLALCVLPVEVLADGRFELQVRAIAGPNAALASAVVRSDKPGELSFSMPEIGLDDIVLTPLPISAKAGPQWDVTLDGRWKFARQAPEKPGSVNAGGDSPWASNWDGIEVPGQWRNQGHDILHR